MTELDFDKRNFENLCHFYREELMALSRGETVQLSVGTLRKLAEKGVLAHNYSGRGVRLIPSDRARKVLGSETN